MVNFISEVMEIVRHDTSIKYLELYGVPVAIMARAHLLQNRTVIIFCDNSAMVAGINASSSSCSNCMVLIRIISQPQKQCVFFLSPCQNKKTFLCW